MSTYLVHFLVYALAMVGMIGLCMFVFKKTMVNPKCTRKDNGLSVENALNLSQRKTLYVVKAGEEKFLIAADAERTSFLAKLNENPNFEPTGQKTNVAPKAFDYSEVMASLNGGKKPVLREMMKKLNDIPQKAAK
ncbi:TPA: flagellar biosynthetic protein FliO [Candidatus Spyradomonas excrementavium]|nr:flagellar biosynthetic protein FliO [Candidatus Spyradomonas excrementavium]